MTPRNKIMQLIDLREAKIRIRTAGALAAKATTLGLTLESHANILLILIR